MIPIEVEILIGLATGLVVGITGASGVLLVVPLLTLLLNFQMHTRRLQLLSPRQCQPQGSFMAGNWRHSWRSGWRPGRQCLCTQRLDE